MRKALAVTAFCGLTLGASWGAAYDDFVKAGALAHVGNRDGALAAYTAALTAGDLAPVYVPQAYIGRAQVFLSQQQCAKALDDLDAALKLSPKLTTAVTLHAYANQCLGKAEAALGDLDTLIAATPTLETYGLRAHFHWDRGEFDLAAADFGQSVSLHSKGSFDWGPGPYNLAWYAIAASRAKHFDKEEFAAKTKNFRLKAWPGPVISFFLGEDKEAEVYEAAGEGEKDAARSHKCEADFFLGEWRIAQGDIASGKVLLEAVTKDCPRSAHAAAAKTDLHRIP